MARIAIVEIGRSPSGWRERQAFGDPARRCRRRPTPDVRSPRLRSACAAFSERPPAGRSAAPRRRDRGNVRLRIGFQLRAWRSPSAPSAKPMARSCDSRTSISTRARRAGGAGLRPARSCSMAHARHYRAIGAATAVDGRTSTTSPAASVAAPSGTTISALDSAAARRRCEPSAGLGIDVQRAVVAAGQTRRAGIRGAHAACRAAPTSRARQCGRGSRAALQAVDQRAAERQVGRQHRHRIARQARAHAPGPGCRTAPACRASSAPSRNGCWPNCASTPGGGPSRRPNAAAGDDQIEGARGIAQGDLDAPGSSGQARPGRGFQPVRAQQRPSAARGCCRRSARARAACRARPVRRRW